MCSWRIATVLQMEKVTVIGFRVALLLMAGWNLMLYTYQMKIYAIEKYNSMCIVEIIARK